MTSRTLNTSHAVARGGRRRCRTAVVSGGGRRAKVSGKGEKRFDRNAALWSGRRTMQKIQDDDEDDASEDSENSQEEGVVGMM